MQLFSLVCKRRGLLSLWVGKYGGAAGIGGPLELQCSMERARLGPPAGRRAVRRDGQVAQVLGPEPRAVRRHCGLLMRLR